MDCLIVRGCGGQAGWEQFSYSHLIRCWGLSVVADGGAPPPHRPRRASRRAGPHRPRHGRARETASGRAAGQKCAVTACCDRLLAAGGAQGRAPQEDDPPAAGGSAGGVSRARASSPRLSILRSPHPPGRAKGGAWLSDQLAAHRAPRPAGKRCRPAACCPPHARLAAAAASSSLLLRG